MTDPLDPPPWPAGMADDIGKLQDADDYAARTRGTELPFGVTRKWFDLDGVPVRMESPLAIPERLNPQTGGWEPLADFCTRLTFEARPVDGAEFEALVAALLAQQAPGKPAPEWEQYLD